MLFNRDKLRNIIVSLFPYSLIAVAAGGIGMAIALGRPDYIIRSLFIIVPCLLVAAVLLYQRKKGIKQVIYHLPEIQVSWKIFVILYLLLSIGSILSCYITEERNFFYLIFILSTISVSIFQIYQKNISVKLILSEIIILGLNIAWSVTLNYPLYFGGTDLLTLSDMLTVFSQSGELLHPDYESSYSAFPLYFIYFSACSFFSSLEPISVLHIFGPLAFILLTPCVFLISRKLFGNERLALLASLLYIVLPDSVYYATYVAPRVTAYLGLLLLVVIAVMRQNESKAKTAKSFSYFILEILIILYIILVHQVSILQMLPLCAAAIAIGYLLFGKWYCIQEFCLTVIIVITYWIYTSFEFLEELVSTRLDFLDSVGISAVPEGRGSIDTTFVSLFENIGIGILLLFVLFGVYLCLCEKGKIHLTDKHMVGLMIAGIFGFIMLVFYLPTPLSLSYFITNTIRADRLLLILSPIYAILGIGGLAYLFTYVNKNTIQILLTIICIAGVGFFSIGTTFDIDISDYDMESKKYFDDAELISLSFAEMYVNSGETINSDYYFWRYFMQKEEEGYSNLKLKYYNAAQTKILEGKQDLGYSILSVKGYKKYGIPIYDGINSNTYYLDDEITNTYLTRERYNSDLCYSNKYVDILLN